MAAAPATLSALLANPAIWRGDDCAPEAAALPTGFAALDAALPGGGWPGAALCEIRLAQEGIGELRLVMPALIALARERRDIVLVAPPYLPYAPALAAAGLDLARLTLVRAAQPADAAWAFEQALRAPECGAAFAWLATADERLLRRLAVAARDGRTLGMLWRRPGELASASVAALRLALAARDQRLEVRVEKRRGGELARPLLLDVGSPVPLPGALPAASPVALPAASPVALPAGQCGVQPAALPARPSRYAH